MASLDTDEKNVLNLVKEYLTKKPFFSIIDITDFVKYRLKSSNLNRTKIEKIVNSLVKKNVIVSGTKLNKENILDTQKRKQILEYIKKNPASNINEVMRALKIGSNHATWHLACLEKFLLIRSVKIDNKRLLFNFQLDPKYDKYHYYLGNESILKIIKLMKTKKEALKLTEISKLSKMHHYTTKKYLDILDKLSLVHVKMENNRKSYLFSHKYYTKVLNSIKKK